MENKYVGKTFRKIESIKREMLKDLYDKCSPKQKELFDRIFSEFGHIEKMNDDKLNSAISLCERTLEKNEKTI